MWPPFVTELVVLWLAWYAVSKTPRPTQRAITRWFWVILVIGGAIGLGYTVLTTGSIPGPGFPE